MLEASDVKKLQFAVDVDLFHTELMCKPSIKLKNFDVEGLEGITVTFLQETPNNQNPKCTVEFK